jgi:peptide deformylase
MNIMTDRNSIITLPNPHLREPSRKIKVVTDQTRQVISDMETALLDWDASRPHEIGVALAAVQIDALERIVIVRHDIDNKEDKRFIVLINPEVIKTEGAIFYDHEGCLSVKDTYGLVPRAEKVRVKALNKDGQEVRIKAEGFLARILQHEIDHTNGIVFVDHVDSEEGFFHLDEKGNLIAMDYEDVKKNNILR